MVAHVWDKEPNIQNETELTVWQEMKTKSSVLICHLRKVWSGSTEGSQQIPHNQLEAADDEGIAFQKCY